MWLLLVIGPALAGKWDGKNGDVVANVDVSAPPEVVYPLVSDLAVFREIWPESCVDDWLVGAQTSGQGARATITYHIDVLRRRLSAVISSAQPDRVVDVDHEGKKGFVTRFQLEPSAEGTHVTMTTFLDPPKWPLTAPFFTRIQPAWQTCQQGALDALAARVGSK
jgi:hypothetical protein